MFFPQFNRDLFSSSGDNGLNPSWNHTFDFDVICPPVAKIRFLVQDEDMFGDSNFVGQAVYPLTSLKTGN